MTNQPLLHGLAAIEHKLLKDNPRWTDALSVPAPNGAQIAINQFRELMFTEVIGENVVRGALLRFVRFSHASPLSSSVLVRDFQP
jgi:hypothetical protein